MGQTVGGGTPLAVSWDVESLLHVSQAIHRLEGFTQTARALFDEARRLTGAQAGYVALLNEHGNENEVLFLESGGSPCDVDPALPMPVRGLRAEAYRRQTTVYDNNFATSEWADFMPAGHVRLDNVMFAPLIVDGRTEGVMGLANKPGGFVSQDAEVATALGEFAAIALANSRNLDRLRETVSELEQALAEVRTLRGIVPICSHCKKVRDEAGYWQQVEQYVTSRSHAEFSHALCADCINEHYGDFVASED